VGSVSTIASSGNMQRKRPHELLKWNCYAFWFRIRKIWDTFWQWLNSIFEKNFHLFWSWGSKTLHLKIHASLKTPHLSRQSYPFSFLCWEHAYNSKTTTVKRNDESHLKFDPKQKMVTEPWTVATRSRNRLRLNHEPNYFCKIYGWRRAKYITTSAFNAKRVFEKPWIFWFLKIECELWD